MVLDLAWFFDGVFTANTFDLITINFPDPWPKARHRKHRFVSHEFAVSLYKICRPNALLTFATDNYAYAREAVTVFENSPHWKNFVAPYVAVDKIQGRPESFFEKLHRLEGAPIYILRYQRT